MPNGTVKFFNAAKKFGFVSPDDGGKDVFVPLASVTAAGVAALIAGQRISFETAPDARGPKAINLTVIDARVPEPAPKKVSPPPPKVRGSAPRLTFYYDPASEYAVRTLAELRKGAFDLRAVDYIATPPNVEELKRLSMFLPAGSLVRRYESLFHDLRLDDRFIGQTEFWNGIFENPTLINGPILATANRTCVCEDDEDVTEFLDSAFPGISRSVTEERVVPEPAAAPVPETPKEEAQAAAAEDADVEDVEPEATDVEPEAADDDAEALPAKRSVKKPAKAAVTKKAAGVKAAATKVAKKAVSEPATKPGRAKPK